MANKFLGFLEAAGKDFEKGLEFLVKVAPELSALAAVIYPPSIATAPAAVTALNLLQNTILSTEQKYAAAGKQSATGSQKLADVLAVAAPAASTLLSQAGVPNVDTTYISNLVTAIVGVLNITAPVPVPVA